MNDIFYYNSGSLLQALSPDRTIEPLTGDPALDTVSEGFLPAVTFNDEIYGVPAGPGFAGGILYNRDIYADLGLEVPKTWAEFEANNEAIKASGISPVLATYADAWTAQLFVLADYYNVAQQAPDFTEKYTNNEAKYATTPAALQGFQRLAEGAEKGWYQDDYLSTTHVDGLGMLARGEVAQYPMLSVVVPAIEADNPGTAEKIGFFAQPSDSADINGATLWLPNALYIAENSENKEAAKDFLRWVTSIESAEYVMSKIPPTGPDRARGRHASRHGAAGREGRAGIRRQRPRLPGTRVPLAGQGPRSPPDLGRGRIGDPRCRGRSGHVRRLMSRSRPSSSDSKVGSP